MGPKRSSGNIYSSSKTDRGNVCSSLLKKVYVVFSPSEQLRLDDDYQVSIKASGKRMRTCSYFFFIEISPTVMAAVCPPIKGLGTEDDVQIEANL